MSQATSRIPWIGVILILLGLALLANKMGWIDLRWSQIVWPFVILFGLVKVGEGFSRTNQGKVFGGTVIFLYGLYFFLRSLDSVYIDSRMFFPGSVLIFGFAFLMMYLNNVRDWAFLVPAVILSAIGGVIILSEYDYVDRWSLYRLLKLYWPVILIAIGLAIILRHRPRTGSGTPSP